MMLALSNHFVCRTQKYKLIVGADAEAEELASTGNYYCSNVVTIIVLMTIVVLM